MQNSNRLDPVIVVWVHHPNDIKRNRIYSATLSEMYNREDPFVGVNGLYAQTPCWLLLAMPVLSVPTILEEKI